MIFNKNALTQSHLIDKHPSNKIHNRSGRILKGWSGNSVSMYRRSREYDTRDIGA